MGQLVVVIVQVVMELEFNCRALVQYNCPSQEKPIEGKMWLSGSTSIVLLLYQVDSKGRM